jgi:L-ribulose-5-phosphate 4-epimerase
MNTEQAKQKLIDAGRILEAEGQADFTRGHVSVRVPGDPDLFFMKPHSYGFGEITRENIVVCNLAGEKVSGSGRRHSEVFIHSEIFKARPDVMSVIHTHPTHAVALSATGLPLKMISQPSAHFADGVPYYNDTMNLIRTEDMGLGVAQALGSSKAVLMRNHGVAIAGRSIEEAVMLALLLDDACRIQLLTEAAGGEGEVFAPEDVLRLHDQVTREEQFTINFDYLCRKMRRAGAHG